MTPRTPDRGIDPTERGPQSADAVLAIVLPDFFHASMTFFHEHIAHIHPGRTVVIHLSSTGAPAHTNVPTLEVTMPVAWRVPPLPLAGVAVRQINAWRGSRVSRARQAKIAAFLRAHGVTHLFAEFAHVGAAVAPLARRLGLPLTSLSHGYDINVLGRMPQWRLRYHRFFRSGARLMAVVPFLREQMIAIGAPRDRIEVIPCAVDAHEFVPVDHHSGPTRVAMVARLTAQKGPLHSLRAFALALQQRPELMLEVVGNGPLWDELVEELARLRIGDRVVLHGEQLHAFALEVLARSHILLQHCLTLPGQGIESQGVSVVEAMGHGAVAIVTRHGGLADHIGADERGLLVEEGDIAGMAERIVAMADRPAERSRIGHAARAWTLATFARAVVYPRLRARIGLDG